MAQPYSTGPVYVWVGISNPPPQSYGQIPLVLQSPKFLGTAETYPRALHRPRFSDVYRDTAGHQPFDTSFQGVDALIDLTLTYWNEVVAIQLERLPSPLRGGIGVYKKNDVGTLMGLEGKTITLWLRYGAQGNRPAMVALPAGYRYPSCICRGPWSNKSGAAEMKRQFIFQAYPKYDAKAETFTLYDYNMSALPIGMDGEPGDLIAEAVTADAQAGQILGVDIPVLPSQL